MPFSSPPGPCAGTPWNSPARLRPPAPLPLTLTLGHSQRLSPGWQDRLSPSPRHGARPTRESRHAQSAWNLVDRVEPPGVCPGAPAWDAEGLGVPGAHWRRGTGPCQHFPAPQPLLLLLLLPLPLGLLLQGPRAHQWGEHPPPPRGCGAGKAPGAPASRRWGDGDGGRGLACAGG